MIVVDPNTTVYRYLDSDQIQQVGVGDFGRIRGKRAVWFGSWLIAISLCWLWKLVRPRADSRRRHSRQRGT